MTKLFRQFTLTSLTTGALVGAVILTATSASAQPRFVPNSDFGGPVPGHFINNSDFGGAVAGNFIPPSSLPGSGSTEGNSNAVQSPAAQAAISSLQNAQAAAPSTTGSATNNLGAVGMSNSTAAAVATVFSGSISSVERISAIANEIMQSGGSLSSAQISEVNSLVAELKADSPKELAAFQELVANAPASDLAGLSAVLSQVEQSQAYVEQVVTAIGQLSKAQ